MAKGYWIGHVTIHDPERYKDYLKLNAIAFAKYGARFVVRGGDYEVKAGDRPQGQRTVVLEFDSLATAKACYESPEYQAALKPRDEAATVDLLIIEGYAG